MKTFYFNVKNKGCLFYLTLIGLGILLHFWTVIVSTINGNIIDGFLSLVFPVLSEIYWFLACWKISGTLFNVYSLLVVVYVLFWVFHRKILGFIKAKFRDKYTETDDGVLVLDKDQYDVEDEDKE